MFKNFIILVLLVVIAYHYIPQQETQGQKTAKGICAMYETIAQEGLKNCQKKNDDLQAACGIEIGLQFSQ